MKNYGCAKTVVIALIFFISMNVIISIFVFTEDEKEAWQKSPVDEFVQKLSQERNFSIILHDMDVKNESAETPDYQHQYSIIRELPDTVTSEITSWYSVAPTFFKKHIDNMGMEIVAKKDGKVTKQAAPAGYSHYVGNEKYGQWNQRNGYSFWEFYGRYAFMSSIFNLMTYPVRRDYWYDYRDNYYGTGRAYYGHSGGNTYGTGSYTSSVSGKKSAWGAKSSDFKRGVRNKVSRSRPTSSSRSYSSSKSYNRTSRSTSRSNSGTSYRSRSGGYGK